MGGTHILWAGSYGPKIPQLCQNTPCNSLGGNEVLSLLGYLEFWDALVLNGLICSQRTVSYTHLTLPTKRIV